MKQDKKLVLPGEFIAGAEEAMPGKNTYSENDEIYSSACGELKEHEKEVVVEQKKERQAEPFIGMELVCMVRRTSPTKAFLDCIPADGIDRPGSRIDISAVLPVQNIKREHVREVKDELRIGDMIKAKITKIERGDVDVSIFGPQYGVIKAFCTVCRKEMVLKEGTLMCTHCERKESRKLSQDYLSGV